MSHEPSGRGARRFVRPLPSHPNLDKQRKLAKALARDYWRGKSEAIARVRALHPKPPAPENFVLSDAQLVIARGYGFAGWPHMKRKIESLTRSPAELFKAAVEASDVDHVRQLLQSDPDLVSMINEPMFSFKSPAVHVARTNLELLDLLLAHGADLNARTSWEKGSFGVRVVGGRGGGRGAHGLDREIHIDLARLLEHQRCLELLAPLDWLLEVRHHDVERAWFELDRFSRFYL